MFDLQPGSYLDNRYHLGAQIARGGMSTVYHAVDTRLDREVAIKVMDPALAKDPTFRARFEREARAVAKLNHPSLVNVFDQGEDGEFVFLVMELVDGGSLRELLRERGPMPPHAALSVMEPVLTALSIAHATGMIHRDLKPDNVLISENHEVKLADFGLVRAVTTEPEAGAPTSASGQVIGTVGYLSPEQVQGQHLGVASDVYSAGILLFELITGATPFKADSHVDTALARLSQDVPHPSSKIGGVPPEIDDLILTACQRDPADRFADGAEFLAAVRDTSAALDLPPFRVPAPADSAVKRALDGSTFSGRRSWDDESMSTRAVSIPPMGTDQPDATAVYPHGDLTPEQRAARQYPADHQTAVTQYQDPAPAEPYPPDQYGPGPHAPVPAPAMASQQNHPAPQQPSTPEPVPRKTPRPSPKRLSNRSPVATVMWVLLIVALVVGIALGSWWLTSGRYGEIPSVVGMDRNAALVEVEDAGFMSDISEEYSNSEPAQKVIGTDPPFGQRAPKGSQVSVLVSLGRPIIPEPGSTDSLDSYITKLTSRTLKGVVGDEVYSDTAKKGTIAELSPAAGTAVDTKSSVTIHVSKGPRPVTVPGVEGQKTETAKSTLEAAGLKVGKITKKFSRSFDPGAALETNPKSGKTVPSGSEVELIVNNAIKVPDVTGASEAEAKQMLRDVGLDPVVGDEIADDSVNGGNVARQSPSADTLVDPSKDTQVAIRVSNSISVPSVFGMRGKKAKEKLEDAGFNVTISGPKNGLVWSQRPGLGKKASKGDTITLSTL